MSMTILLYFSLHSPPAYAPKGALCVRVNVNSKNSGVACAAKTFVYVR